MFLNPLKYKAILLWGIPSLSDITNTVKKAGSAIGDFVSHNAKLPSVNLPHIGGAVGNAIESITSVAAGVVDSAKDAVENGLASVSDALTTKIMNGIVSWLSNTIGQMCSFLTDSFTTNFAPNIDSFFGMFGCDTDPANIHWLTFSYSPDGTLLDAFRLFAYIGVILAILIYVIQLIASAMADYTDAKDTPGQLTVRFCISLFTINFSTGIISIFFDFAENVWDYCTTMAFAYGSAASNTASLSLGSLISTMVLGAATGGVSTIAALIINIICAIMLTKEILKYMVEIVERYFVACVLYMVFPAIAGTYVSKKTSMVEAYFKMLICQLILIICNLLFMKLVILLMCALIAKNSGDLLPGSTIFYTIIIIGFLRVAERIDQYMRSLGLNPAQTGGNLLDTGMLGAHMLMSDMSKAGRGVGGFLNNAAANAMRRGNFAQAEGLRRAAGIMDPRFGVGTAGGRSGAGASGQDMVNFAKKSGMDANAAFGAQAVKNYMAEGLAKGQGQARNDFNSLTDENKGDMLKDMFGNNLDNAMFGEKPNNIEATKDGLHFSSDGKDYALSRNNLGAAIGQVKDANGNTWYLSGANPNGTAMRNAQPFRNVQDGTYAGGKGMQQFEASLGMSRSKIASAAGLSEGAIAGYQKAGNKFDITDKNGNVIGFANSQKDGSTTFGATKLAQMTGALASQQTDGNVKFGMNSGLNGGTGAAGAGNGINGASASNGVNGKSGSGPAGSSMGAPGGSGPAMGTTGQSINAQSVNSTAKGSGNSNPVGSMGGMNAGSTGGKSASVNGINGTPAAGSTNSGASSTSGIRNSSVMRAMKHAAEADSMPGNGTVEKGSSLYDAAVKGGFLDPSEVNAISLSDDGKGGYLAENADATGSDRICHFTPIANADDASGYKVTATDENGVMYGLSDADNDPIDPGSDDTTAHQLLAASDSVSQSFSDSGNDLSADQVAGFMNAFIKGNDENAETMDIPGQFDGESFVAGSTSLPDIESDGSSITFAYPDGNTYVAELGTDDYGNPSFNVFDGSSNDRSKPLETWSQTGKDFNWNRMSVVDAESRAKYDQSVASDLQQETDFDSDDDNYYPSFTEAENRRRFEAFQKDCKDEENGQNVHQKRKH